MPRLPFQSSMKQLSIGSQGFSQESLTNTYIPDSEPSEPQIKYQYTSSIAPYLTYSSPPIQAVLMILAAGGIGSTSYNLYFRLCYSDTGSSPWTSIYNSYKLVSGNYKWTVQGFVYNPVLNRYYGLKLWTTASSQIYYNLKVRDVWATRPFVNLNKILTPILINIPTSKRPPITEGSSPAIYSTRNVRIRNGTLLYKDLGPDNRTFKTLYADSYGVAQTLGDYVYSNQVLSQTHSTYHPYYYACYTINMIKWREILHLEKLKVEI